MRPGLRVGYCIAPAHITGELRKVHQFNTFSIPTAFQHAIAESGRRPSIFDELTPFFARKQALLEQGLAGSAFTVLAAQGSYSRW